MLCAIFRTVWKAGTTGLVRVHFRAAPSDLPSILTCSEARSNQVIHFIGPRNCYFLSVPSNHSSQLKLKLNCLSCPSPSAKPTCLASATFPLPPLFTSLVSLTFFLLSLSRNGQRSGNCTFGRTGPKSRVTSDDGRRGRRRQRSAPRKTRGGIAGGHDGGAARLADAVGYGAAEDKSWDR